MVILYAGSKGGGDEGIGQGIGEKVTTGSFIKVMTGSSTVCMIVGSFIMGSTAGLVPVLLIGVLYVTREAGALPVVAL
jgi:hypothetical protein